MRLARLHPPAALCPAPRRPRTRRRPARPPMRPRVTTRPRPPLPPQGRAPAPISPPQTRALVFAPTAPTPRLNVPAVCRQRPPSATGFRQRGQSRRGRPPCRRRSQSGPTTLCSPAQPRPPGLAPSHQRRHLASPACRARRQSAAPRCRETAQHPTLRTPASDRMSVAGLRPNPLRGHKKSPRRPVFRGAGHPSP